MTTICTLQHLSLTFPHKIIFKSANFNLNKGDRIGVLGLNGHGKSSLFHILTDQIKPDTTIPPFLYDKGRDLSIFLVPQELPQYKGISAVNYFYEFFPDLKKLKNELHQVEAGFSDEDISAAQMDKLIDRQTKLYEELEKKQDTLLHGRYVSYLKYFGIADAAHEVTAMSGGEQRKVALSLGLSAPHSLILWDEPTNHLDMSTIEMFEEELMSSDKTFMIITHDRELLNNVVERIVHIQHGQIRSYSGTYQQYVLFLQEQEQNRIKAVEKLSNFQRRETAWITRGVKARRTKSKKRIEDYSTLNERIKQLRAQKHAKVSLGLRTTSRQTKILIEADSISHKLGGKQLFTNLSATLAKGDKIALIGDNGTGKSTLLKLMMGDLQPNGGTIKRPDNLTVGYFSQQRETLNPDITPWQLVGKGIDFVISNTGDKRHVAGYLESFLFSSDEIKRPIKTFSGGEKNRLQLALFMKDAQDVWVFDEPTNDLDLETIGVLEEELKNYKGALVVVGHDRAFLENVTDKCWLIDQQQLQIFEGGLSQGMSYIEEKKLEIKLKELEQKSNNSQTVKINKNNQSQKNKNRIAQIEEKMALLEIENKKIQEELAAFDYTANDKMVFQKKNKVETKLSTIQKEIESLMEEWSSLEA